MKDGRTSDEPPGSQIMVARPKSLVPGPNSSSAASPFTGSQHLLKALRKRVKVSLGILRNSRADLSIRFSWCRACQSRPVRVTHRLESRMREIRTSGSEGGVGSIPPFLPLYRVKVPRRPDKGNCIAARQGCPP